MKIIRVGVDLAKSVFVRGKIPQSHQLHYGLGVSTSCFI